MHDALVDHALPRASQLDTPSLEALVLPLFKEVARKHCPAALVAALQTSPCIAVGSPAEGRRVLPSECYDPRNQGLKDLVGDDAAFPLDSWASDAELLQALEMLGMRTTVNPDTLASIARKLQQDAEDDAVTKQTLERRAGALLQALDHLVSQSTPDSGPAEGFWAELEQIAFLPVHAQPPLQGLPWPEGGVQETLAPPRRVRLESAAWLVSASLRLLKGPCSEALAEKLGLNAPPPPKVLTAQLLGLGYAHAHVSDAELQHTLEGASAEIFSQLNSSEVLDGPLGEVVLELLRSGPTIWVDDGYVAPSQVAIDTPRNFKPWLHAVPESLASSSALLSAIGVPATPTPVQYVQALGRMADELGMGDTLLEDNLLTAIALTECLGSALVGASPRAALQADIVKTAVLPDAEGAFAPASQLYINDAPWLAHEDLRMVHPDVPTEAAAALGAQSLRLHHQVETQTSERLPCPPAALLRQLLQSQGDPGEKINLPKTLEESLFLYSLPN